MKLNSWFCMQISVRSSRGKPEHFSSKRNFVKSQISENSLISVSRLESNRRALKWRSHFTACAFTCLREFQLICLAYGNRRVLGSKIASRLTRTCNGNENTSRLAHITLNESDLPWAKANWIWVNPRIRSKALEITAWRFRTTLKILSHIFPRLNAHRT